MKQLLLVVILWIAGQSYAQDQPKFNLGLEEKEEGASLPKGWMKWGDYALSIVEAAHTGKLSGKISSDEQGSSFGSIAYKIPAGYKGNKIQLKGFMKIKEVKNGFAGLLLRVDGEDGVLVFDNMKSEEIQGTKDWEEYSITLDYPKEAANIYVAGILVGKGEAWFDDFAVSIDGKNIESLKKIKPKPIAPAKLDKEFDKGSSIVIDNWNEQTLQDLELLGKVWGFVKYHHTAVAEGNYNWDYELFRFLPQYLEAKTTTARDKALVKWIKGFGKLRACKNCEQVDNPKSFLTPNLTWITQQNTALKNTLLQLYQDRSHGKHYYIGMAPGVGNPIFKGEKAYPYMTYPDDGFRLLALFRYWNMINYFFPYRHLMDEDWNLALKKHLPAFLEAEDELAYEKAMVKIIGDIQDTHAQLQGGDKLYEWKGTYFSPLYVRFVENQLVVLDYYDKKYKPEVGLEIGDIITHINGKPVEELVEERAPYYPASNKPTQLRNMSRDLLRAQEPQITITYQSSNQQEQKKVLTLYKASAVDFSGWYEEKKALPSHKMLEGNIGYITLGTLEEEEIESIKKDFKNTKGIVIDIRNYPNAFTPFTLAPYLVSSPTPFVKFTKGNASHPGEFTFTKSLKVPRKGEQYEGKVVILVNQETQSSAEYQTMALRAGKKVRVIGSTTAGADGNVSTILLPGGLKSMISGIGVYYPDGKETQRVGVALDVEVLPTIEGIRAGRDELLEKAVELIEEQ